MGSGACERPCQLGEHLAALDLVGMKHEVFNEVERGKVFAELTRALASA